MKIEDVISSMSSEELNELKKEIFSERYGISARKIMNSNNTELKNSLWDLIKQVCSESKIDIIRQYYGFDGCEKKTQKEIAKQYNLSSSRIGDIIRETLHRSLQPKSIPATLILKAKYYSKIYKAFGIENAEELFNLDKF